MYTTSANFVQWTENLPINRWQQLLNNWSLGGLDNWFICQVDADFKNILIHYSSNGDLKMYLAEGYSTKVAHPHVNAFQVDENF